MSPPGFHPLLTEWFASRIGQPTDLQEKAWPAIASGRHVLITAPTGSGKTLSAFLWALNQLITSQWPIGRTSVLYVSPLKALNTDIQRNLLGPLEELRALFDEREARFPDIRVLTRSGDTPQAERRQMLRHPPEILITTPESLNLLLSSIRGRELFRGLSTVILDEIHSVYPNKRGVHLITAVERLVPLAGEFQRVGLSATLRPIEGFAAFLGGYQIKRDGKETSYSPRPVDILRSEGSKEYDLQIVFPREAANLQGEETIWDGIAFELRRIVERNRSTLIFVNGRRLCEMLTLKINAFEEEPIAYAHHGSLSREIRLEVERRLKDGELRAIVATSSLEMGIDIGELDEVVLVQSPPSVSSSIQRIGRAGHQIGRSSRATLIPTHSVDFLEAATLADAILKSDIEELTPIECPLDLLAQQIVSMVGTETWNLDRLYEEIRCGLPFYQLSRPHFDLVVDMLAGRYRDSRIRELHPRIIVDRLENTASARKGGTLSLFLSGGVIPDRGYYHMRHLETGARIGELDEEFVWEALVGDRFTLGTQAWKIEEITANDVLVSPESSLSNAPPFWRAENLGRDFHYSERIGSLLEEIEQTKDEAELAGRLQSERFMDELAIERVLDLVRNQREATSRPLPHRHHVLVEHIEAVVGAQSGHQTALHTFWGGRVNRPYALALRAAWRERYGVPLEIYPTNDVIGLLLPERTPAGEILAMVNQDNVERLLRESLDESAFFGAQFREAAGRSLLLERSRGRERVPLWLSRLRAKKLLATVAGYRDFPIVLEAWRSCLRDSFDLGALRQVLAEMESGRIAWSECETPRPSPMAQTLAWLQVNEFMYEDDTPVAGRRGRLSGSLLEELVFQPGLRPSIPRHLALEFGRKRRRLAEGYAPPEPRELLDWLVERILMPLPEWVELCGQIERTAGRPVTELLEEIEGKVIELRGQALSHPLIAARESLPRIASLFPLLAASVEISDLAGEKEIPAAVDEADDEDRLETLQILLREWLSFYEPVSLDFICGALGLQHERAKEIMDELVQEGRLVRGQLVEESEETLLCDSENFEILLRRKRAAGRRAIRPLPAESLQLFLAKWQGLLDPVDRPEDLGAILDQFDGYPAEASLWEREILPARADAYKTAWLDLSLQREGRIWSGFPGKKVAFWSDPFLLAELTSPDHAKADAKVEEKAEETAEGMTETGSRSPSEVERLFPDALGKYDFFTMLRRSGWDSAKLNEVLWQAVWQGLITADSFQDIRTGLRTNFRARKEEPKAPVRRFARKSGRRPSFAQWKAGLPATGNWQLLRDGEDREKDPLQKAQDARDRVRILIDRYGVLFRELLQRELPGLQWANISRTLRLMEFSGEVIAGQFFEGPAGLQFAAPEAIKMLERGLPHGAIYWLNACDPASICGLGIAGPDTDLPDRSTSNHLVFKGAQLLLVSKRQGKDLDFRVPPEDAEAGVAFCLFRHLLGREFDPLRRLRIETINGEKAARSPYLEVLRRAFDVDADYRGASVYSAAGR